MSTLRVDRIEPYLSSSIDIVGYTAATGGATTGSNNFIGNQTVTGSIDITGQFLVNGTPITGSGGGSIDTASFATTGSNVFQGNQNINGTLAVTASGGSELKVNNDGTVDVTSTGGFNIIGNVGIVSGGLNADGGVTASVQTNEIQVSGQQLFIGAGSGVAIAMGGNKLEVSGSIDANGDITGNNINGNTISAGGAVSSSIGFSGDGSGISNVNAVTLDGLDSTVFATTGSNTFIGDQTITGSIKLSDKIESTGKIILKPEETDPRYLEVYNTAAQDTHITASGGYLYLGDDTTYVAVNNYGVDRVIYITADNGLTISGSTNITGSVNITGDYKINGVSITGSGGTIDTGSFATTGSNTFEGNQTINGVAGGSALFVSKSLGIFAPEISVGDYNSGNGINVTTGNNGTSSLSSAINMVANQQAQIEMYANGGNFDSLNIRVTNGDSGVSFKDWDGFGLSEFMNVGTLAGNVDFKRNTNITGSLSVSNQANLNGGLTVYGGANINGAATFNNLLIASGGLTVLQQTSFEGGLQVNGPVRGNTTSPALVTGSIQLDWSTENFFSIELAETASTFIDVVNINEAQTVNVRVRTQPGATASFSENVWQKSGSLYTPTNGTGIDILTFISFDTEYAYLANITNFSGSYIEPPSPGTTTTTTTVIPYEYTPVGYHATNSGSACADSSSGFWSPCSSITIGCRLSPGSALAAAMDNGFYALSGSWFEVTGGDGVISASGSCS